MGQHAIAPFKSVGHHDHLAIHRGKADLANAANLVNNVPYAVVKRFGSGWEPLSGDEAPTGKCSLQAFWTKVMARMKTVTRLFPSTLPTAAIK